MTPLRRLLIAVVALVAVGSLAGTAVAADPVELGGKLRTGDRVVVETDELVPGNLYVIAGSAEIHGTVRGDLAVTGGSVVVDGLVEEDLLVLGGNVTVPGGVGGHVVVFGGNVTISGPVGGDVLASGGRISLAGDVAGDVRAGAGELRVAGTVGGDVASVGGSTNVVGTVGADLLVAAGELRIDGTVRGSAVGTAGTYERRGSVGGDERITLPERTEPTPGDRVLSGVFRFLAVLVVTVAVVLVARRSVDRIVDTAVDRPGWSLLAGLVAFAGAIVALVATIVVGIVVSFAFAAARLGLVVATYWFAFGVLWVVVGFTAFVVANFGAPIVVGLGAGKLAGVSLDATASRIGVLAAAVAAYTVLVALPWVGGLFGFLAFLLALGAPILAFRAAREAGDRPEPAVS